MADTLGFRQTDTDFFSKTRPKSRQVRTSENLKVNPDFVRVLLQISMVSFFDIRQKMKNIDIKVLQTLAFVARISSEIWKTQDILIEWRTVR